MDRQWSYVNSAKSKAHSKVEIRSTTDFSTEETSESLSCKLMEFIANTPKRGDIKLFGKVEETEPLELCYP